jgi:hypothetical protein
MNRNDKPAPTPTDERRDAPGVGRTERSREGRAEPRLPHERDESSDSQDNTPPTQREASAQERGEQAFDDLASGRQDTGRLPVTDEVYEKLKKPPEPDRKRPSRG